MPYLFESIMTLVLIAQWTGLHGLASHGRSGAWRFMIAGTSLITVGLLCRFLLYGIGRLPNMPGWGEIHEVLMMGVYFIPLLGFLFFAIGFALHGTRLARHRERIDELEMMNLAQATELERLRNR